MDSKPSCGFCKLIINELEPVRCGLCELFFHLNQDCCGFTSKSSRELFKSGKAMFFCSGCCGILNGRSMKAFIEDIKASSAPPAGAGAFDDLTLTAGSTAAPYSSIVAGTRGTKRRRSDEHSAPASKTGTKSLVFERLSISNITLKPEPPRFWLYLAGFNPLITNDGIKLIVSQCMGIPDLQPDVTRLVKKSADTSRLSFVSFKVGLDPEHESLALDDIWPEGISFREFEDWSKNSTDQAVTNEADFPVLNPGSMSDSSM